MDFEIHRIQGLRYYDKKKFADAIESFRKALEIKDDKKVWYYRGLAHYKLQEYESAISCFDKALEIDENFIDGWIAKAKALQLLDKYREVVKCYDKALSLDPGNAELKKLKRDIEYIWNY